MMTKEGSTKIINFMIPGVGVVVLGGAHILGHLVKMYYLFKNFLSRINQTNLVTKEWSTKTLNFMTPGAEVHC